MTVEQILGRLQGVRRSGSGWIALCPGPGHLDRHQSLSVGEGEEGRVLLKCHAGCSLDEILRPLGLTTGDLFAGDNGHGAEQKTIAVYDYRDETGRLLFQVLRYASKTFRQRRPDGRGGWIWNLDGVRRILYRLPELIAELQAKPAGERVVYIPEGEKDVDRLRSFGLQATTNPGGAGKWREEYTAQLNAAGAESVVILPDTIPPVKITLTPWRGPASKAGSR